MAHLDKLAIRGIRSFDDKEIAVMEFFSPVTVIVGHNGSGKTTIIECLKYATTGDQPPNTRGGAFIHDPKMANEKEVKAQVKLRFHAASGQRMLVVRNVSVTVKKTGAMAMKTLESILGIDDPEKTAKRGTISTKCAELDTEIPHLLGVSKAVLENVTFCHQEDSYWPLSEPSTLKKKFDDIFEATRYTKALDAIKNLRKERVAELKVDKERLERLSGEKSHADKLRSRIVELGQLISKKQVEYEETKGSHDALTIANTKLYEYSHKFRKVFDRADALEKQRERYQQDLAEAKETTEEIRGTQHELEDRVRNFEQHRQKQMEARQDEEDRRIQFEDEIHQQREDLEKLREEIGKLVAEEKAQEERIQTREVLIREISTRQNIRGYDHSPLEREKVFEFINRLNDLQDKQVRQLEEIQNEKRQKDQEYERKMRQLTATLEGFKAQKQSLKLQISNLQNSINEAEAKIDESQTLPAELRNTKTDMDSKRERLEQLRTESKAAKYEERLAQCSQQSSLLQAKRDSLNAEFSKLSLNADMRAKLSLKRAEVQTKRGEVDNTLQLNKGKFRKTVGTEPNEETMERELDRAALDKDRDYADAEAHAASANRDLQQAETTLSHLKTDLRAKQHELRKLEKHIETELSKEYESVAAAMSICQEELAIREKNLGAGEGASGVFTQLLKLGQQQKKCTACNRHLDDAEMELFVKFLNERVEATKEDKREGLKAEVQDWQQELERIQALQTPDAQCARLKTERVPALEKQIGELDAKIPALSQIAEEASKRIDEIKRELKDITSMKQQASLVTKTLKDIERIVQEIKLLENDLETTGSAKTADDVQDELNALADSLRLNEREKDNILKLRDTQSQNARRAEMELHSMQLHESELRAQIREREHLEERLETYRRDILTATSQIKEMDDKIAHAQGPVDRLQAESQQMRTELEGRIQEAMDVCQQINKDVDKLDAFNRAIEKYVREKRGKGLRESQTRSEELKAEIAELVAQLENARLAVAAIDKEINEGGATLANLRSNIRIHKLEVDIAAIAEEIEGLDVEEAGRARAVFEQKYNAEKAKETRLASHYARLDGELASLRSQLADQDQDAKEFKDIQKKFTDQLVKVKMSDMANNDLEKYAKALDNAIMKYHSLKMEEVNDNMRHLWNKTYQGTDIDGIKIRYDAEGGASKRSYNYRVVMTKDQVEMDMRGRCSAGQKMLASIIIRLALSDSFGQNCGILALDEPTNALDVENIDALAASLVDIINERKNHSNFQLIIITHDENFLRKLGQSEVMEHYWRVSRDAKQKSIIERQRFR